MEVSKEEEQTITNMGLRVPNQQFDAPLTLEARFMPQMNDAPSCIVYVITNANNYETKLCMIQLLLQFHGLSNEIFIYM